MIKSYLTALVTAIVCAFGVNAQIVTSDPSPLQEDSQNVSVYFHADQGNKGLINQPASAAIYAHTGVSIIGKDGKEANWQYVKASWSQNLPECKMEYVSPNLWKLNIGDLHNYYGVPADVQITKLCFVFRGANGSPEGKGPGNTDIFLPVSDAGFQIALTASVAEGAITSSTGAVTFTLSSTKAANLAIAVNGANIKSAAGSKSLTASYTFPGTGDYSVTATANDGTETKTQSLSYCMAPASEASGLTTPPPMGATRNTDGSVTFCIAAPQKQNAMVIGSWNDYKPTVSQVMAYTDEKIDDANFRFFSVTLPESQIPRNSRVIYYFLIDNSIAVGDPYARLALDPYNDKYISPSVFPDLPEYPETKITGTPVAVFADNIDAYDWQTTDFKAPAQTDLIIYEMLLRDFTGTEGKAEGNGTVRGAIDKIPYLKSLGINAVELLPINEFSGNISWGYNPNFYFAVDKAYGTPADYKEFIDKCHAEGIAVILDMVFNQSDGLHPWYMMYTPGQNPFYNLNAPHAYSVLNDWNQGYPLVDRQWKDVIQYWLKEYKVDGFRFDLVKGLGDNNSYSDSGDAATNAFNQSRIDRMKRLHSYVKEINPDAYFINENLAGAQEENKMAEDGEMNWANVNTAGCQFAMGYASDSNLSRMWAVDDSRTVGSTVSYLESHDEERLAYKQNQFGVSGVKGNSTVSCQRLGSAAAQMLLVPGSHMIWQFSEMGNAQTTKSGSSNNTDPKIVNWNLLNNSDHKALWESYQELISLRLNNPDLFPSTPKADFTTNCKANNWADGRSIIARAGDKELYCAINPNITGTINIYVPFRKQDNSAYEIYSQSQGCDGSFSAVGNIITVPANCYIVVCSRGVSGVSDILTDNGKQQTLACGGRGVIEIVSTIPADIYDLTGKKIAHTDSPDEISVTAGIYIVTSGTKTAKILVR